MVWASAPRTAEIPAGRCPGRRRSAARTDSRAADAPGPAAGRESDTAVPASTSGIGNGSQQALRVRIARPLEQLRGRRVLEHLAGVHHDDLVGHAGDDAEIVRDQDDAGSRLLPSAFLMRSRICAWIVTSSAVVGSSAISSSGLAGQRHRDHHALAHAAGKLVRIVVDARARVGDADHLQHLDGVLVAPALRCSRDAAA